MSSWQESTESFVGGRRFFGLACALIALAGCKTSEQCNPATSCAKGSYQACTDGAQCRFVASDGQSFACASCGNCQSAVSAAVSWCGASGVGGNGNGNGNGGGGLTETQACMDYLSCAAAATPAQLPTLITTYGPSGTCWQSAALASACDGACTMALAQLRSTPNPPAACGGSGGSGGAGGGGSGGGGGGGGAAVDMAVVKTYQTTTVAQMRLGLPGDFEIDGVVTIGLTPSTTSPRLFFQDVNGGDFSAMMGRCSAASPTHPCYVASTIAAVTEGRVLTLKGTYVRNKNNASEDFYIDDVTVGASHVLPAPATAQLADVQRGAATVKWWFQRVRVDLGSTTLKMFDFSPAELKYTSPTGAVCPAYFGWGMVLSTSPDTVGSACMGTTQPPSAVVGTAPSDEVIIGTDFYQSFRYSADCACAASQQATLLTAASVVTYSVGGILIGDLPFQQTTMIQYLAPKSSADALLH